MGPRGVEIDPFDCESQERDLHIVLWDDPDDLCTLCLDLWDFWVSSDAETQAWKEKKKKKAHNQKSVEPKKEDKAVRQLSFDLEIVKVKSEDTTDPMCPPASSTFLKRT